MNIFAEINKKLDEGFKMTDASCSKCKNSVLASPNLEEFYCVGCK